MAQKVYIQFNSDLTTSEFNKLHRNIIKHGIYYGGDLTIGNDANDIPTGQVAIEPFIIYVYAPTSTGQAVKIESDTRIIFTPDEYQRCITGSFTWNNNESDELIIQSKYQYELSDIDIVFGEVSFSNSLPSSINYENRSYVYQLEQDVNKTGSPSFLSLNLTDVNVFFKAGNPNKSGQNQLWFDSNKGAFRSGFNFGTAWRDDNVGEFSHAEGCNTIASNTSSHAEGYNSEATGDSSHSEGHSAVASGSQSHSEGHSTEASGIASHAEGYHTIASGDSGSHSEGNSTEASGNSSHAEGAETKATGSSSHSEGSNTESNGDESHAEGGYTKAEGENSHSEGFFTIANGMYSHVEGHYAEANGSSSHAEGSRTVASGNWSHAEGSQTEASGTYSHAEGYYTNTNNQGYSHIMGRFGDASDSGSWHLANGTSSSNRGLAAKITGAGIGYADTWSTAGADYAEFFEWEDGNNKNEDRVGYFVTLDGEKICKAKKGDDYILGVVSGNPSVTGNTAALNWKGRFLTDDFGRKIYEKVEKKAVYDDEGIMVEPAISEMRAKINPEWEPQKEYISRENRKEWSAVGMLGQLLIRDDRSCKVNGYCMPDDKGRATKSDNGYRVIKRISKNVIKIIFR